MGSSKKVLSTTTSPSCWRRISRRRSASELVFAGASLPGLFIASLALVPLTVLFYSPPPSSVLGWISHLGPASLFLALATYCLRQAAHYRRQALELRNKRLGMDTAFRAMSDQLTDEQRRNLQQHLAGHGAGRSGASDGARVPVPESLSMLPLDRLPSPERFVSSMAELLRKEPGPADQPDVEVAAP